MSIALQKGGCKDGEADLQRTLIDFSKTAGGDYDQARICREVGVAVHDGMSQCIFGDYDKCARSILPIRDRIYIIGGSNAQRDLFTQTIIHALYQLVRPGHFLKGLCYPRWKKFNQQAVTNQ
ncbi:hypothetical protein ANCDUO_02716 [Ancylostoma duodenale]|uniref:Uncharacterized protein n=1 Tax=Ancylostoma duodenale TaxID=51022 RepID=A0A0C2H5Z9_9BILA|nr:hypothetical protein ANCDUO_02716 [Ancylostoma duodenale]